MKKSIVKLLGGLLTLALISVFYSCSNGSSDDNGNTDPDTGTVQTATTYKSYEVTLNRNASADEIALLLQTDNDGSQNANGLSITISDLELSVKVGDNDAVTVKKESVNLVPNQYASPAYSKTDARFLLGVGNVAAGTTITIQVKKATISNTAKTNDIIFALQSDTAYDMLADDGMWQPIFAEAE